MEVVKEHQYDLTDTTLDEQTWKKDGEVLDDDIALSKYAGEKGISLQLVEQENDKGEGMSELELDHFSWLLDQVFETFHRSGKPKSEVADLSLFAHSS